MYKITVAYDGTDYNGWQIQKDMPTVVGILQDSFYDVFKEKIIIRGASRTDAGVHALGQVALFKSSLVLSLDSMQRAWNNHLPSDISIRTIELACASFQLHKDVVQKTYIYHFFTERPLPFVARYGWFIRKNISLSKLEQVLQIFVGTHDFRSFSTGDERGDDTIRTIDAIELRYLRRYNAYAIVIKGPKFLRYMIRRIVGACIAVATRQDLTANDVKRVLAQKNPLHTLPNAPAKGLVLYKIFYATHASKQ